VFRDVTPCSPLDVCRHLGRSYKKRRGSSVGTATGYTLEDRGVEVRIPVGSRIFTSPCGPDRLGGTPKQWALSQRVKRQGREADHSPPTSTEVKKT
jgi:hypothetical protein